MKTYEEIAIEAIAKYGTDKQLTVAIEKMAELTKEICKYNGETKKITETMADVYIVLFQMKFIFHNAVDVQAVTEQKIRRLARRLYWMDKQPNKPRTEQTAK